MEKYLDFNSALEAVTKNGLEIKYCKPEIMINIAVLKAAVKQNYFALREIKNAKNPIDNDLIINNKELMFELIKIDPKVFRDIGPNLKDDEEIVIYCVSRNGSMLKEASSRLKNDKRIIITALSSSIYALDGLTLSEDLKNDKEIALNILRYRHPRFNVKWFGNNLKQEIIDALGYDVTLDPLNQKVIDQVKDYLRCKMDGKEFVKPECPIKIEKEEKPVVKEEPKVEVKPIVKEEPIKEVKPVIKEEPKVEIKPFKEEIKPEVKTNNISEIEKDVTEDLAILNKLFTELQNSQKKLDDLKKQINVVEEEINKIKIEVKDYSNGIKQKVLNIK